MDMSDPSRPELSILIVGYNAVEWLDRCLTSLAHDGRPSVSHEVVLVDNASCPRLDEALIYDLSDLRVLTLKYNVGFGNAVNIARVHARGKFLLLLNPDIEVLPGSIDRLLGFFQEDRSRGIVGGRTQAPDGRMDPRNAFNQPTLWSQVCFATGLSTTFPRSPLFNPETIPGWNRETPRNVGVVTGCTLLTSTTVWDKLSGFDPSFFMYGEDVDLSRRAIRAGFQPTVDSSANFIHAFGASSTSNLKRVMVLRGKASLYRKHGTAWSRPISTLLLLTGVLLRAVLERLTGSHVRDWRHAWSARREWRRGWDRDPVSQVILSDSGPASRA
jgi:GT2 family glycosyltransferase